MDCFKRQLPRNPISFTPDQLTYLRDFKMDLASYFAKQQPEFDSTQVDGLVNKFTSVAFFDGQVPQGYEPKEEIVVERFLEDSAVNNFMDIIFNAHGKFTAKRAAFDHLR